MTQVVYDTDKYLTLNNTLLILYHVYDADNYLISKNTLLILYHVYDAGSL
jgi:hypothetical protein